MSASFIRGRRNFTELKKPTLSPAEHRRLQEITGTRKSAAEKNCWSRPYTYEEQIIESIKIRSFSEFKEKDFVPRSELTKVKNAIYCKKKRQKTSVAVYGCKHQNRTPLTTTFKFIWVMFIIVTACGLIFLFIWFLPEIMF